ncbi:MAG: hypothetical protein IPG71_00685 [bacterium]|nr:hypothetical protein [bacterium]
MHRNIVHLAALFLILLAISSAAHARRALLRPPDRYKGIEINGVKYVVGQVYVAQFTDTSALKPFGFRGFETMGSTVYYKRVKAIWPLDTDYDALPDLVVGLNYEKVANPDDAKQLYMRGGEEQLRAGPYFTNYGTYYNGPVTYKGAYGSTCGSRYYNDGRPGSYAPYWAWPHDYNPEAYRYHTTTRTNLKPTIIGSYPTNKFLQRKYWGGGPVR